MAIKFITGNSRKFNEAKELIPNIEQLNIDLEEIQSLDSRKIIEYKLKQAQKHEKGKLFCEDVSVEIHELNDFPGPLIKWYVNALGVDGVYNQCKHLKNQNTTAKVLIGYSDGNKVKFFEGTLNGKIVKPKGTSKFGWDNCFKPDTHSKTFGEMALEEKNQISPRSIALNKLKKYLEENS